MSEQSPEEYQFGSKPFNPTIDQLIALRGVDVQSRNKEQALLNVISTVRESIVNEYRERYVGAEAAAFAAAIERVRFAPIGAIGTVRKPGKNNKLLPDNEVFWDFEKIATTDQGIVYRQVISIGLPSAGHEPYLDKSITGAAIARGGKVSTSMYRSDFFGVKPRLFRGYDLQACQQAFIAALFENPSSVSVNSTVEIIGDPESARHVDTAQVKKTSNNEWMAVFNSMLDAPTYGSTEVRDLLKLAPEVYAHAAAIYKHIDILLNSDVKQIDRSHHFRMEDPVIEYDLYRLTNSAAIGESTALTDLQSLIAILYRFNKHKNDIELITELLQFKYNQFKATRGKDALKRVERFEHMLSEVDDSNPVIVEPWVNEFGVVF